MSSNDSVEVAGEVRGETDLSYKFWDGDKMCMLPKSKCEWDEDGGTMTMPEWLAMNEGLI